MQQYLGLKAEVPDALLFFRLGDFYELFLEDAEIAAPLLDLVLTTRNKNVPDPVPMCGIPFHAAEGYVRRLLAAGHSVAVAEQMQEASQARGLVRREIVEVVTPGLVADPDRLEGAGANYLAAVLAADGAWGLAYVDVSTGEFAATRSSEAELLAAELDRISPREILVRETEKDLGSATPLRTTEDSDFVVQSVAERAGRLPSGLEPDDSSPEAGAAAALWMAVSKLQPHALKQLRTLRRYVLADRLLLDPATRRHLELVANLADGGKRGTLLEHLDRTRTPMGARRLVDWIGAPLRSPARIRARQAQVESWLEPDSRRIQLRDALREVGDLARALSRASLPPGPGGPRALVGLRRSLEAAARVDQRVPLAAQQPELGPRLRAALIDDPSPAPRGEPYTGYVRDGADPAVDEIRADAAEGERYLANLEGEQRKRTGIPTLRLKYNRVFGYSIEVTRTHLAKVPPEYRRKQTTAAGERFTTDELEGWERQVRHSKERAAEAEAATLRQLHAAVLEAAPGIQALADEIAELDAVQSLAEVAREYDYVRPDVCEDLPLEIEAGRHPVVERFTPDGFVPNDVSIDGERAQLLVLTGPNMAGKSTLLRQVGLTVLLAQMGSFVPARSARIGVADRIFTRVGASDSIVTGESTFMVEMRETAEILREATPRSLVLLDEIGRGTSTYDGLSIAWAVAEFLHDAPGLRPRTLFATHYHELADLAGTKARVRNFHFSCLSQGDEILFLRRMEPGAASRSYGIEVARRAGLPPQVIQRAREVLANLEGGEFDEQGRPRLARAPGTGPPAQLGLFAPATPAEDPLRAALRKLEPDAMTPLEALVELARLHKEAKAKA